MEPAARVGDAIVIGGGVIGLACSLELVERGLSVILLERDRVGSGASEGNCGLITPSHALPLNRPGRVLEVLGRMLRPDAPIHVRPSAGLTMLAWAMRFTEGCEPLAVQRALRARAALLSSSRSIFEGWQASGQLGCEWEARGLLVVCASEESLAEERRAARGPLAELGIEARILGRDGMLELEPALRENLAGGVFFPGDAHLRPEALVRWLAARLRERGGEIEEGCEVLGLSASAAGVEAALTTHGERRARAYVLAAGAWSPSLARSLGLRLPIVPGKGYTLSLACQRGAPRFPLVLHERSVAVTPWPSGLRLGGTMEFAGFDPSLRPDRLDALRDGARRYLRTELDGARAEAWAGWRPMTPDETPILGRSPKHGNLFLATGHGMLGVCAGPASARLVAELVTGTEPHLDPRPYLPQRFA